MKTDPCKCKIKLVYVPNTYDVEVFEDGSECWYLNGKIHRENGPALNGPFNTEEYYLNGIQYSKKEYKKEIKKLKQ